MRYFIFEEILIIILITLSHLSSKSQEISTIGEIYDFEVGDIFHYYNDYYHMTVHKTIYEITDKYYSIDNDTLFYTRDFQEAWRDFQGTIWNYSSGTQTIHFTLLDSLINGGVINYIYSDTMWYNGRIINGNMVCEDEVVEYVVGCGLVFDYLSICGTGEFIHFFDLKYYKKNEEEWGTPLNLYTKINPIIDNLKITIYPNPTSNTIQIKAENFIGLEEANLYTITGNLVKSQILNETGSTKMDLAILDKGIYIMELVASDQKIRKKIIKR